jgi:hypothetical protein
MVVRATRGSRRRSASSSATFGIEPETGAYEIVAEATVGAGTKYDYRGLLLDQHGRVVVFASSVAAQKHRFAVLAERPGGFDAWLTPRRDRALSAAPLADHVGFALYFEPDRPPTDRSRDSDDDPEPGEKGTAGMRLPALPLRQVARGKIESLLR